MRYLAGLALFILCACQPLSPGSSSVNDSLQVDEEIPPTDPAPMPDPEPVPDPGPAPMPDPEPVPDPTTFGTTAATMWDPVEWSVSNKTYSGNPFDLDAKVEFVHSETGAKITSGMFYSGSSAWSFRFTGTLMGKWTFKTASTDMDLNELTGAVEVGPRASPSVTGFLVHKGNRFAVMTQDQDHLQPYLLNVFMNQNIVGGLDTLQSTTVQRQYLEEARNNGFRAVFVFVAHQWLKLGASSSSQHSSENPDLKSFVLLEQFIDRAAAMGIRVHIWMWGDKAAGTSPHDLPGGPNGAVDKRLQKYIAARLGPLPGWSLSYGYDLREWTTAEMRNSWVDFMHAEMGWPHLLATRGWKLNTSKNVINSYSSWRDGSADELNTGENAPNSYSEILNIVSSDTKRPAFLEERHVYKRYTMLDMSGTRRLLWRSAMAGGLGGIYGFFKASPYPYPRPDQLRTLDEFWHKGSRLGMDQSVRNNIALSSRTYAFAGSAGLIIYAEDRSSVEVDLSSYSASFNAIAVDTNEAYAEVSLGRVNSGDKITLTMPKQSDWAVYLKKD